MYYQLQCIIRDEISSGSLKPGDYIPTELELSEIFDVSRTTVRQAVMGLVMEGKLHRLKGKGTYVAEPKFLQDFMNKLESFDDQIERLGLPAKTKLITMDVVLPPSEVSDVFGSGDEVICLNRLRYAGDEPIVTVKTYLPYFCEQILKENLNKTRLYDFLARSVRTKIKRVTRQIEVVTADTYDSELLDVPVGSPIQLTTTIGRSMADEPIEYSIARYRGDKNIFVIHLEV